MNGRIVKKALVVCFAFWGRCACCAPIPLRCLIVGGDGGVLPVSAETVSNKVNEVNRIFRQAAMSFAVESCVVTNAVGLFEIDETNTVQRSRLYSMLPNGDGLKMIFVNRISGDAEAFWSHYGIIISASAQAVVVAHEIGHACGLEDVYSEYAGSNFVVAVSGKARKERMPDDWGRSLGSLDQSDVVKRLLMYGYDDNTGVDIPYGDIDGVWQDADNMQTAYVNSNCWHTTLAPVGFHYHGNRHPRSEDWVED